MHWLGLFLCKTIELTKTDMYLEEELVGANKLLQNTLIEQSHILNITWSS